MTLNEVFSDYFAQQDNYLTRLDARLKMLLVCGAILMILFSPTPHWPVIIAVLSTALLISIKIPFKNIFIRLLPPLTLAAVVLLAQFFFYQENLSLGFLLIGKIIGCVSAIIFLSMTTPVNALLKGAAWFRISKTWLGIAEITYRYIFVLLEDAITIRDAQRVRLGYSSLSRSARSLAELSGSVFIRAYDQSLATSQAMQTRGSAGKNADD